MQTYGYTKKRYRGRRRYKKNEEKRMNEEEEYEGNEKEVRKKWYDNTNVGTTIEGLKIILQNERLYILNLNILFMYIKLKIKLNLWLTALRGATPVN